MLYRWDPPTCDSVLRGARKGEAVELTEDEAAGVRAAWHPLDPLAALAPCEPDPLGAASAPSLDAIPPVESTPEAAPLFSPAARDVPLPEPPQSPATLTPPRRKRRR